uniref:Protein Gawky n=1 Tax=Rhabditophanes sp. KR3021 TaxID=114890 RepID=A0AC35UBC6_9BILA
MWDSESGAETATLNPSWNSANNGAPNAVWSANTSNSRVNTKTPNHSSQNTTNTSSTPASAWPNPGFNQQSNNQQGNAAYQNLASNNQLQQQQGNNQQTQPQTTAWTQGNSWSGMSGGTSTYADHAKKNMHQNSSSPVSGSRSMSSNGSLSGGMPTTQNNIRGYDGGGVSNQQWGNVKIDQGTPWDSSMGVNPNLISSAINNNPNMSSVERNTIGMPLSMTAGGTANPMSQQSQQWSQNSGGGDSSQHTKMMYEQHIQNSGHWVAPQTGEASNDMMWQDPNPKLKKIQRDIGTGIWGDPSQQPEIKRWKIDEGDDTVSSMSLLYPGNSDWSQHSLNYGASGKNGNVGNCWDISGQVPIPAQSAAILPQQGNPRLPYSHLSCSTGQNNLENWSNTNISPSMNPVENNNLLEQSNAAINMKNINNDTLATLSMGQQPFKDTIDDDSFINELVQTKNEMSHNQTGQYIHGNDMSGMSNSIIENQSRLTQWTKQCGMGGDQMPQGVKNMFSSIQMMSLQSDDNNEGNTWKCGALDWSPPSMGTSNIMQHGLSDDLINSFDRVLGVNDYDDGPQEFIPGKKWEYRDPKILAEDPNATPGSSKPNPLVISPTSRDYTAFANSTQSNYGNYNMANSYNQGYSNYNSGMSGAYNNMLNNAVGGRARSNTTSAIPTNPQTVSNQAGYGMVRSSGSDAANYYNQSATAAQRQTMLNATDDLRKTFWMLVNLNGITEQIVLSIIKKVAQLVNYIPAINNMAMFKLNTSNYVLCLNRIKAELSNNYQNTTVKFLSEYDFERFQKTLASSTKVSGYMYYQPQSQQQQPQQSQPQQPQGNMNSYQQQFQQWSNGDNSSNQWMGNSSNNNMMSGDMMGRYGGPYSSDDLNRQF